MPQSRLSKDDLFRKVFDAIRTSGWGVLSLPDQSDGSRRFRVYRDEESHSLRIYIWNVTHGGGQNRPANEYRIQVTPTSINQFQSEPQGLTLILGFWQQQNVFAAWDYSKHSGQLGRSPSFQINEDVLLNAAQHGIAPYEKDSGEIAIAIRPDYFMDYVANLDDLHELGQTQESIQVLKKATEDPSQINDTIMASLDEPRREIMRTLTQKLRRRRFREDVLKAYARQCAFCALQLGLVEAAHIVPVFDARSQDVTPNGLALCALHHRAYDRELVTVDVVEGHYRTLVNRYALNALATLGLGGGHDEFIGGLRADLVLPSSQKDRPNENMLRIANQLRHWEELEPSDIQIVR